MNFLKFNHRDQKTVLIIYTQITTVPQLNLTTFCAESLNIWIYKPAMLVSFEGMTKTEIRIMNLVTGSAVCIIVFLFGLNLFRSKTDRV